MKHVKRFETFRDDISTLKSGFSDIIKDIKRTPSDIKQLGTEIKGIVTTKKDKEIKALFDEIRETFNRSQLTGKKHSFLGYDLFYKHDNLNIKMHYTPATFEIADSYDLYIDNKEINCSYILKMKMYKFFKKQLRIS